MPSMSELLTTEGFDVATFEGGEAAWSAMTNGQEQPRVVVADVRTPRLAGVGLLRRIRGRFPDVPVLSLAFAEEAVWLEALAAGAVDVFRRTDPSIGADSRVAGCCRRPAGA